ncbi:O-methyltransferase [Novosphingobium lentum]|uniref:O-methyltransferase n=1 Tax=Novosphingobium lentum TaxID=145287 RepID=UPI000A075373|nr:class I SAM-dependent methyltransferase [Novosphingobium lentum]
MTMDIAITALLNDLEARWQREQAEQASLSRADAYAKVDDYLLPVGPETGRLMNDLIRALRPAVVVEIGSSYGYSTLWLAEAARAVGGKVVSFEIHAGKIAAAKAMLASVDLDPVVRFVQGDALASLEAFAGEIGFVLIDLWKDLYIPCFDRIADKLAPGAIVIADNMTFPPDNADNAVAYRARIRADARFESVLLPIGAGIEVTRRLP